MTEALPLALMIGSVPTEFAVTEPGTLVPLGVEGPAEAPYELVATGADCATVRLGSVKAATLPVISAMTRERVERSGMRDTSIFSAETESKA